MMPVLFGSILQYLLGISLFLVALFLILLILVQRGRGGGQHPVGGIELDTREHGTSDVGAGGSGGLSGGTR